MCGCSFSVLRPFWPGHIQFEERTGKTILERYGMTETNMSISNPYEEGARIAGTVGKPLRGVEIRIADAETKSLLKLARSEVIEQRGDNVFLGYWKCLKRPQEILP